MNPRSPKIFKESEHEKAVTGRLLPIKKKKHSPTPGDYDVCKAFKKSQLGNTEFCFPKAPLVNFTEEIKKRKKGIPGIGHYKQDP